MEPNKKSTIRTVLIIFASILFYTVLQNTRLLAEWLSFIGNVMAPIFIGIVLAFLINLPLNLFEKRIFAGVGKKKPKLWNAVRRPICLVLSVVVFLGIITLVFFLIVPEVKNTAVGVIKALPGQAETLVGELREWINRLRLPIDVTELFDEPDWNSISKELLSGITDTGSTVITTTIDVTSGVVGGLFNFVIGFALSIYVLSAKEKLARHGKRLLAAILPKEKCDRAVSVIRMSGNVFTKFIAGQLAEALIIGVICYVGMIVFRMPYALMVSAIIAVTALVPVVGTFVGTAFGALMILFVSPIKAIGFVIFIIVAQQIDNNLIYPRIVGSSVGLPGIWVLCAVTVGGGFFGALGILLSVPVCAVLYFLVGEFVVKKEKLSGEETAVDAAAPHSDGDGPN